MSNLCRLAFALTRILFKKLFAEIQVFRSYCQLVFISKVIDIINTYFAFLIHSRINLAIAGPSVPLARRSLAPFSFIKSTTF
jgi:hypothetical protein